MRFAVPEVLTTSHSPRAWVRSRNSTEASPVSSEPAASSMWHGVSRPSERGLRRW